jgi:tRNA (adenine57-N1/adenine58-N1)-methyltransferase catalytic subunit
MYETLIRPHDVTAPPAAPPSVRAVANRLREAEVRKEEKRQVQIRASRAKNAAAGPSHEKRKIEYLNDVPESVETAKRVRVDDPVKMEGVEEEVQTTAADVVSPGATGDIDRETDSAVPPEVPPRKRRDILPLGESPARRATVSKAFAEVRGHTSYLTFAVFYPMLESANAKSGEVDAEVQDNDRVGSTETGHAPEGPTLDG